MYDEINQVIEQIPPKGYNLRIGEIKIFRDIMEFWYCQDIFIGASSKSREEAIDNWAEDVIKRGHWVSSRYIGEKVRLLKERE